VQFFEKVYAIAKDGLVQQAGGHFWRSHHLDRTSQQLVVHGASAKEGGQPRSFLVFGLCSIVLNSVPTGEYMKHAGWALFTLLTVQVSAQTVVGSARVICSENMYEMSGPIVGVIINQTSTTINDLEVELTVLKRNKKGEIVVQRDVRFVVVPSLNQTG
jgi:hypothetical protein